MQCGTMEALHCTNKERCVLVKVSTVTPSKIIKRMIMRHILLMILMTFNGFYCCFSKVTIQKKNTYIIYTSLNTSRVVDYAAKELEDYLHRTTGAMCVFKRNDVCKANQLIFGTKTSAILPDSFSSGEQPGEDGYIIEIEDNLFSISGGNARGVLYGVYSFLEEYLNCRWYASDAFYIPFKGSVTLQSGKLAYTPPVKWREVYYYDLFDSYLAGVLKLNGNALKQGQVQPNRFAVKGGANAGWGYWCHSLYTMVPPSLYKSHPEYFSEINGKRIPPAGPEGGTQLCLTNPDVLSLSVEQLKKDMVKPMTGLPLWADSLAYYWSVSQMDGNGNCTCSHCMALDKYDGSPSGSILNYVNKVAAQFPDKKIATLAYIYSRKAPKYTKPASNVAIQLCAIETARDGINEPIGTSPLHTSFRKDMESWGKICKDIIVWDYVIQFQNLVSPFPNFDVMQSNIQFYTKNNATGIFCQGNREKGGEFAELRGYLLSKLLWNPDCDVEKVMDDFLQGYYGISGKYIKQYISLMESELKKSKLRLSMDGEPEAHRNGYLSEVCINQYNKLFDLAEQSVAHDSLLLARVQKDRMPLMYVQLRLKYGTVEKRRKILDELIHLAEIYDIWMFSEVDWRSDQSGNREMFKKKIESQL